MASFFLAQHPMSNHSAPAVGDRVHSQHRGEMQQIGTARFGAFFAVFSAFIA
jgi:hypothetical protein